MARPIRPDKTGAFAPPRCHRPIHARTLLAVDLLGLKYGMLGPLNIKNASDGASRRAESLAHRARPLPRGGGQKSDIGLGGDELRAALDGLDLAFDIAIAATAWEDAIRARSFDHPVLGCDNVGVVELSCFAHVGEHIVAAEVNNIDTGNCGDLLDVVEPLDGLD